MRIAYAAAKGLAFLHSDEARVIYRDLKSSNILLDVHYNAKLSDFGLARDGPTGDRSYFFTRVMGTHGCAAPEDVATGHLTTKSDTYSFEVVLLELLSGRRVIDKNRPNGEQKLVEWAKPYLTNKRKIFRVLDPRIEGLYSLDHAVKIANIALKCLLFDPKLRPNINDIVKDLEKLQGSQDGTKNTRREIPHPSPNNRGPAGFQSCRHILQQVLESPVFMGKAKPSCWEDRERMMA